MALFFIKYTMKIDYQLLINMKLYFFGIIWLNERYSLIFGLQPLFWEGAPLDQNFIYLIKNFKIFKNFFLILAKFWIKWGVNYVRVGIIHSFTAPQTWQQIFTFFYQNRAFCILPLKNKIQGPIKCEWLLQS